MATRSPLKISGKVVYIDGKEAAGAKVRIIEHDLAGGTNDRSPVVTADLDGSYEVSIDWKDSEGLGFPDVELFTFEVKIDGKSHKGPLFHNRGRATTIIVPWPPPKPIGKTGRELVQIIYVSNGYVGAERRLYEFIELSSEALTRTVLGGLYSRLTFVKGTDATLPGLVAALEAATARSRTKAVDLLFTTHGNANEMVFADGEIPDMAVAGAIQDIIPAARLKKLRIVFSTACIGHSHLDAWMKAGFTAASGSKGIYADSAVSYVPFLSAWASEQRFAQAIDAANDADPLDAADNLAKAYYRSKGEVDRVDRIDSERVYSGNGRTRIYSNP
jgi:hypothetical protein